MGLFKAGAGRAKLGPQVGHRVEPQNICSPAGVKQQGVDRVEEHIGVMIVQVDLIGRERFGRIEPREGAV